jgi:BirA family transcriptional regulator, biotin operon repressor / biotin---[acetyl-CoA-carboxylase] ligase
MAEAHTERSLVERVFRALHDGEFHSGEELAGRLRVSRSAVWKAAHSLRDLGSTVHAVRNRGYRLCGAREPLDAAAIQGALGRTARARLRHLGVAWTTTSTNTVLLERLSPPPGQAEAALAEFQSAGRGRRGKSWLAPPGGAVCLSLSWTFAQMPRDAGSLSLAIGVCVLRALQSSGVAGLQLKWPNDVQLGEAKLGGILIELRAEAAGPASAVIGIGLNIALGAALIARLADAGVAAADLAACGAVLPGRNALAAQLIDSCIEGLLQFEEHGLRIFMEEWRKADALRGRPVTVVSGDERMRGLARGIDLTGALLVESPQGVRKFVTGEVSVRASV